MSTQDKLLLSVTSTIPMAINSVQIVSQQQYVFAPGNFFAIIIFIHVHKYFNKKLFVKCFKSALGTIGVNSCVQWSEFEMACLFASSFTCLLSLEC